ncbi:zinc transporter 2-like [Protopterus annectens]|uniref:zinc transporter 2-like n=1 Tax=Protopterus annectens TaxID=7888 RepID=UPI001CF9955E|nr:zinc transporter 2-like [Protopterus annectens]
MSNLLEWINRDNMSFVHNGNHQNTQGTVDFMFKNLEKECLQLKKIQIENQYLRECLRCEQVPKGLRHWCFPNGLTFNSDLHKDLVVLFNRQGCELLQLLVNDNEKKFLVLQDVVNKLDASIKNYVNFSNKLNEYNTIFVNIDKVMDKIKEKKNKKLLRDAKDYESGVAYPLSVNGHVNYGTTNSNNNNDVFIDKGMVESEYQGSIKILGALLSVLSIWVVTGVLVYLAAERIISNNFEIEGEVMLITSGCAVAVNIIMAVTLHDFGRHHHVHSHSHGQKEKSSCHGSNHSHVQNPSVRAAFIHVMGDLLQSLGVLVAAIVIFLKPDYKIADPVCTFVFSVLVLGTTITILKDVLRVLMEGTPRGVNFNEVRDALLSVHGVKAVHSLHIWALTMNQPVLSVHIAINQDADAQVVLKEASNLLQRQFDFHTTTIQIENYSDDMKNCRNCQEPKD